MNKPTCIFFLISLIFPIVACSPTVTRISAPTSESSQASTVIPQATTTFTPTNTPTLTRTPTMTRTPTKTATPTLTPTITDTPTPSQTPLGGGGGQIAYSYYIVNSNFNKGVGNWWDSRNINIVNFDGTDDKEVAVAKRPQTYREFSWSPDGKRFYYHMNGRLCQVAMDNYPDKENCFLDADDGFEISPDGGQFIYRISDLCYIGSFSSTKKTRIITGNTGDCGKWSPNGNQMVYTYQIKEPNYKRIFILDLATGEKIQLTKGQSFDPAWSPNGDAIAFRQFTGDGNVLEIFTIDSEGIRQNQITYFSSRVGAPQWSPDGKRIAFLFPETMAMCRSQISIVELETWRLKTVNSRNVCGFTWSPDSSMMAYCADPDRDDKYGIYIADFNNDESTLIVDGLDLCSSNIQWKP